MSWCAKIPQSPSEWFYYSRGAEGWVDPESRSQAPPWASFLVSAPLVYSAAFDNTTYKLYAEFTNGKEPVNVLERNGWAVRRIRGSHHIMVKPGFRTIPVPVHGAKDLPAGLIKAIMKEACLE